METETVETTVETVDYAATIKEAVIKGAVTAIAGVVATHVATTLIAKAAVAVQARRNKKNQETTAE